ncbi:hypothetical protein Hanom_Chr10g00878381 [Helianthus anomalus]
MGMGSDLEEKLKDVWIGSYKLFIVPAIFVDGKKISSGKGKGIDRTMHGGKVWKPVNEHDNVKNVEEVARSFKDTLLNKAAEESTLEVVVDSEGKVFAEFYEQGIVVRVNDFQTLTSLRSLLREVVKGQVNLKYVGGLSVIVIFGSWVEKEEFLGLKDVWREWFASVEPWSGQSLVVDRIAWIKIHVLPIHIAEAKVFDVIAGKFGLVIQSALFPEEGDVPYACVGIMSKSIDRINSRCKVVWKEMSYMVRVEEDVEEWFPDCLMEFDEEEEVSNSEQVVDTENNPHRQQKHVGSDSMPHCNGVFACHILEKSVTKGSKRKGGKYSKKKAAMRSSTSPLDKDRPKKRFREDNDMFDIDRFIFTNHDASGVGSTVSNKVGEVEEFMTPDLNGDVARGGEAGFEKATPEGEGVEVVVNEDGIRQEVLDTLAFAKDLGVSNIDSFENSVMKVVNEEGFQLVDQ